MNVLAAQRLIGIDFWGSGRPASRLRDAPVLWALVASQRLLGRVQARLRIHAGVCSVSVRS
jgi:hypothetical protein